MSHDTTLLPWTRSTYCGGGDCVEAALVGDGRVAVRDSKNPGAGVHMFDMEEWVAFLKGVRAGEFDFSS